MRILERKIVFDELPNKKPFNLKKNIREKNYVECEIRCLDLKPLKPRQK